MKTYNDGLLEAAKVSREYGDCNYGCHEAIAEQIEALAAQEDKPQEQSADGSLSVNDAIEKVMELYPGADRLALQTLAYALTKPPEQSADDLLRDGAAGCRGYATMLHFDGEEASAKEWNEKADRIDAHLNRKEV